MTGGNSSESPPIPQLVLQTGMNEKQSMRGTNADGMKPPHPEIAGEMKKLMSIVHMENARILNFNLSS